MEIKEIRLKSLAELQELLIVEREKLEEIKYKVTQNQLKKVREIRSLKKDVAQIMTVLKELSRVK